MDFFEAQDQARSKTKWLILLFIMAVIAMGTLIYFGVSVALVSQVDSTMPLVSLERFLTVIGLVAALVLACSLWKVNALKQGGSSIAVMLGGTRIPADPKDAKLKQYRNLVEEMAIASGIRIPEIFVLQEENGINAFAAGYTPDNAAVAVSQGCLDQLDRDELQGVIAHEYSHILNGDMRINSRMIGVLFGLLALAVVGRFALRGFAHTGRRRSRGRGKGGAGVVVIIAIVVMIVGYVGVFFGRLIQSAISRQREFLADAAAVQFTRNPGGIANALRKIRLLSAGSRIENPDAMEASHLFFSNALSKSFTSIFSTHPPLEKRIAAIDPSGTTKKALKVKTPPSSTPTGKAPPPTPGELVSSLGGVEDETLSQARSALESLPSDLSQLARNPATASSILLAAIGIDANQRSFEKLNPVQQQSLFEISLSSFKELPVHELETKRREMRRLARSDGVIDFNEQCLLIAIERSIQNFHTNSKFGHRPFSQSRRAIEIVLSAVALSGSTEDTQSKEAFDHGSSAFNAFGAFLKPQFDHAREADSLAEAITLTSESIMAVRKTVILAAAKIVAHDQTLGPEELKRVRSLCAALECPMPQWVLS